MSKIKLFDSIDDVEKWVNESKIHIESVNFFTFKNTGKFMLIYRELIKLQEKQNNNEVHQ